MTQSVARGAEHLYLEVPGAGGREGRGHLGTPRYQFTRWPPDFSSTFLLKKEVSPHVVLVVMSVPDLFELTALLPKNLKNQLALTGIDADGLIQRSVEQQIIVIVLQCWYLHNSHE